MSLVFKPKHAKGDSFIPPELPVVEDVIIENGALVANPAVTDQLYKDWVKEQELKKKRGSSYCSCVLYAKSLTGYSQSVGAARNWPKNSPVPVVGGVVVTNESRIGHVGVILSIDGDSITITEANYYRCKKSTRTILLSSPVIKVSGLHKTNE